jgi:hypothetical protein
MEDDHIFLLLKADLKLFKWKMTLIVSPSLKYRVKGIYALPSKYKRIKHVSV